MKDVGCICNQCENYGSCNRHVLSGDQKKELKKIFISYFNSVGFKQYQDYNEFYDILLELNHLKMSEIQKEIT